MSDHYELLGVAPSASPADIRRAYARLARDKHPDRFTDPAEKERAEKAFQEITAAFNALMNPRTREEHDQKRGRPTPSTPEEVAADAFERSGPALEAGQVEEAITLLRTAVYHGPANPAYHAALGHALARLPAHAREAVQALEKATQLDPRNASAFADLAAVLARQGLRLRAQKAAEAALRLAPRDARIARLAAELGLGQG
ncbi:MAG TPA: DnaJ domain-containing protein [Vicinamibacteria bacterium]|jgi:curved DNA-binding protein CbpA|nr:DnaJ domain-containing protein [Vicinamibacteria bacterium]